jgi:hypothetical protein
MKIIAHWHSEIPKWLLFLGAAILTICSTTLMFAGAAGNELQDLIAAEQWHKLAQATNIFQEIDLLERLGQDLNERPAVLDRLRNMGAKYHPLRRPLIAYLMCQFGDSSEVESVSKAFFAGEYYRGQSLEPDGYAATSNATDAAYRVLILYGTQEAREKLLEFFKLADDPFHKAGNLCDILLGLSSTKHGPGLPIGYLKELFPLELAIACLDYTKKSGTVISAPGGKVVSQIGQRIGNQQQGSLTVYGAVSSYTRRGCDDAAQAVQNISGRDFGHRSDDPVSQRDKAIEAIKKWWDESHAGKSQ